MQRGRGGMGGFFGFGGPFPGFGGPFPGSGGFVPPVNPMSSFLGGTNPFDDPFFTDPLGAMIRPSLFEQSMFMPSMFGLHRGLGGVNNAGGFQQQGPEPSRTKGPIIKELSSDDEDDTDKVDEKKNANPSKHPRIGKEPYVEEPDEVQDNKRFKHGQLGREYFRAGTSYPQPQTVRFQSSTVTYGGPNGACYTSSTTRRSSGDGVTIEESKEANTATGKATHRIARGIGSKGHALTRKLNDDGKVNSMQTLHNLNEDELAGFEESWQRKAGHNLSAWDPRINMHSNGAIHSGIRGENEMFALPAPNEMFALPAPNQSHGSNSSRARRRPLNGSSHSQGHPRS